VLPGRGATQLGGDDVPICVHVPHWLAGRVLDALTAAGIAAEVREARSELTLPDGKTEYLYMDRFTFGALAGPNVHDSQRLRAAARLQALIDAIPEARGGC